MAETYYSILTSIGKAQIANGIGLGTKVDFVKMKVGDGNGTYYNPTESQLDLVHTVWEGPIGHVAVDEDNPNWLNIEVLIPPDVGGFMIREYAVFDANNHMLAIAKCAETYKPLPSDGSTKEINMKMVLAVSNTSSITLKIDPSILFAKKKDVDEVNTKVEEVTSIVNGLATQLSDMVYQVAGGTATTLTLTTQTLVNGYAKTFIANANNSGAATTINGKQLYKPGTTTAPNLITGKAYTVWYNSTGNYFFIKASAEGNTVESHVLAGDTFSNDIDTGLVGTMPNNGAVSSALTNNNQEYTIPAGFHNGLGKIKAIITNLAAAVIKAGTTVGGIVGTFTADATALAADIISGKSAYVNGVKVAGTATIESLGGRRPANGTASASSATYTANSAAGGINVRTLSASGLGFTPSFIYGYSASGYSTFSWCSNTPDRITVSSYSSSSDYSYPISISTTTAISLGVFDGGFNMCVVGSTSNASFNWIAFS